MTIIEDTEWIIIEMEKNNMNYELAKKLKYAGFPFDSWEVGRDQIVWEDGDASNEPTLSELIEACGEHFGELQQIKPFEDELYCKNCNNKRLIEFGAKFNWIASFRRFPLSVQGQTPEEAVANLWLELKK